MKVLVTGATGAVGPRVVAALNDAGISVRTFSIHHSPPGAFPEGVEELIGDITDPVAVQSAVNGVDGIIHLAALLHIVDPSTELQGKFERINVGGTINVVEAALKAGVKRIVFFSTIAVYGTSDGAVLDELSPTHPDTFYAQTKCAAERIVLDAKNADMQPIGTVLRFGAVYGSRIKGNYERLTHSLARNRFIPVGNGLNRRTLIYDKDVGRSAVAAVSHPNAAGKIFNVTDGVFHSLKDIIASICSALGRRSPQFSLPLGPVRGIINLIEKGSNTLGLKPPVTRVMLDKYTEDIAVDGTLIQRELGFIPEYNLKSGWEETILNMRRSGAL